MSQSSPTARLSVSLLTAACLALVSGCKSATPEDVPPVDAASATPAEVAPPAPEAVPAKPAEAPKVEPAPAEAPKPDAAKPAEPAPVDGAKTEAEPPVCPACEGAGCAAPDASAKAEREADLKALQSSHSGTVAAVLAGEFKAFVSSGRAENSPRLVIQVNRVGGLDTAEVNRNAVTGDINLALSGTSGIVTTDALYGNSATGRTRAIHDAFEPEAKALGLLPTRRLSDSPAYIVDTKVVKAEKGLVLEMQARETASGKVAWSASHAL